MKVLSAPNVITLQGGSYSCYKSFIIHHPNIQTHLQS